MMKDALGNEVKIGDLCAVQIGDQWIRVEVAKIHEGGTVIAPNPTQQGMTPDRMTVQYSVTFMDSPPGSPHAPLLRLVNPAKEVVMHIVTQKPS